MISLAVCFVKDTPLIRYFFLAKFFPACTDFVGIIDCRGVRQESDSIKYQMKQEVNIHLEMYFFLFLMSSLPVMKTMMMQTQMTPV